MKTCPPPSAPWAQRYEDLRRHVLDRPQRLGAAPLGLGLLQQQGLAGWMRAWEPAPLSGAVPGTPASSVLRRPTPEWQCELTTLLAQMTLAHLPGTFSL